MKIRLLVFAMLALCWGAFSHHTSAQTISCTSQDGGRQFCPADTRGGVTTQIPCPFRQERLE